MDGYIANLLLKYVHKTPAKPQLSPHHHRGINYGSKEQLMAEEDTSPKLTDAGITRVQGIVSMILYYARSVYNILLVGLSAIGVQQALTTEQNTAAIDQLLDQVATYPNNGINYQASDMILAAHSDAGFNNYSKARSHAGATYFYRKTNQRPSGTELSSRFPRSSNL